MKNQIRTKVIALLMAAVMMFSLLPFSAFAEEDLPEEPVEESEEIFLPENEEEQEEEIIIPEEEFEELENLAEEDSETIPEESEEINEEILPPENEDEPEEPIVIPEEEPEEELPEEPAEEPEEEPEEDTLPTDEELEQGIPAERIQEETVSLLSGGSYRYDFAKYSEILKISISDPEVICRAEVIGSEESSEELPDNDAEEADDAEAIADAEEAADSDPADVSDADSDADPDEDADTVPQVELEGNIKGTSVIKVFYLDAEGEKSLYIYNATVEEFEEELLPADEEAEGDVPEERIQEEAVSVLSGESRRFAFANYSEIQEISISDPEIICRAEVIRSEESSEEIPDNSAEEAADTEETTDADPADVSDTDSNSDPNGETNAVPEIELEGNLEGSTSVKVIYLNAEGEKCLYIYNASVEAPEEEVPSDEELEKDIPEERIQKKTVSVLLGQSRKFAFGEYSKLLKISVSDSEIISRAEVIDPEEDSDAAPQVELEGNLEGTAAVKVFYLNAEGEKCLYIYNATVRDSSGLVGYSASESTVNLASGEIAYVALFSKLSSNLFKSGGKTISKFDAKNLKWDSNTTVTISNDSVVKKAVLKNFTGSDRVSDNGNAIIVTAGAVSTDSECKLTIRNLKYNTTTIIDDFNITVKVKAVTPSTVEFRIVNGTWNTTYDGIVAENVSSDGTTISFVTYPDILSSKQGMYYYNCSRTHDTDINTTHCLTMESVLLAILKDNGGEYIIPDTGYYVDFAYQDWTIDSGSALNSSSQDLFDNNKPKTGRNQMQQVANGIHNFDDNGHSSGDDAQGFRANTVYTLTLLKEPYDDNNKVDYTVHYYYEGTTTKVYDDKVVLGKQAGTPYSEVALGKTNYSVYYMQGSNRVYSTTQAITPVKNTTNEITFFYAEPPVTIYYQSADTDMGTVSRSNEVLSPTLGVAQGSIATQKTGYHFVEWKKGGTQVGTETEYIPTAPYTNGDTYIAYFEKDNPALTVTKEITSTAKASDGKYALNEEIKYKITVKNTGNVKITGISITDALTEKGFEFDANQTTTGIILEPGQDTVVTGSYKVTEADIETGSVTNSATATGKDPKNEDTTNTGSTPPAPTEEQKPALTVTKTSDAANKKVKVGDTISYIIKVENTGNQTITDITVIDTMGRTGASVTLATGESWEIGSLAPGASKELHASYEVTAEDVAAGEVTNAATIDSSKAKDPDGKTPDVDDEGGSTEDETVGQLTITKTSDATGKKLKAGDTINYTIKVENTGKKEITGITVIDTMGRTGAVVTLATGESWEIGSLAAGASKELHASYEVTAEDVAAGEVTNAATIDPSKAKDPDGKTPDVDDEGGSTKDETVGQLTITKTSKLPDGKTKVATGDTINYTIKVENTGKKEITGITVIDTMGRSGASVTLATGESWEIGSLAAGASKELHASYEVTAEDVAAGEVTNAATIDPSKAKDPSGNPPAVDNEHGTTDDKTAAEVLLSGSKTLTGFPMDITPPDFIFVLKQGTSEVSREAVTGSGEFSIKIECSETGTFTYTLSEIDDEKHGFTYDSEEYSITVAVTDEDGKLVATATATDKAGNPVELTAFNFENLYEPDPATETFGGKETLTGKELSEDEFSFTITSVDENGDPVLDPSGKPVTATVKNKKDGTIPYPEKVFEEPGTYYYTVEQNTPTEPGITADDNKYTVKVVVTDDGSGELKTNVTVTDKNGTTVNPDQMSFRNEFKSGFLQIGKIVTGNLADKNQPFPFQISFGADGTYSYSGSYSGTLSSGDTIRLRHGEQIVISGLPAGIKYTVKETDNAGYTASATGDTGTITEGSVSKAIFTNTKNGSKTASPQTGDSSGFGLWLAALALSTVGVPVTLTAGKKKRR